MLLSLATLAIGVVAALSATTAVIAETLRFAHVYELSEPYHKWALWAAGEIKKRTNGRYEIQVFPASTLGKEQDLYAGLMLGTIDLTYTGSFYASRDYGPMAISSAPFMFRDFQHWSAYRDSSFFREISDTFTQKTGDKVLALVYYGEREVTSNKPVRTPADMKGMKFRTPDSPMYTMFPRAVGANPTPIAFAEVYLALQNGTVDGQENPLPTILAKKFYEVQKYISLTGHITDSLLTLASSNTWKKLSDADKAIFEAVYKESAARCTDEIRALESQLATEFETKYKVTVIKVDRKPFQDAMAKELQATNLPWTPEQYQKVQAIR
jgi:tripartite ATP-independent transporter DctP family solute receptor